MKESRYNVDVTIDENRGMLYNTFSRGYYIYKVEDKEAFMALLHNINKGEYSPKEIGIIKELIHNKIIIEDGQDELNELIYQENMVRYQSDTFSIMVIVTEGCNFRCSYCIQDHNSVSLDEISKEKIIKLISVMSKKVRKIRMSWFGGEPTLQFQSIEEMSRKMIHICEENHCIFEAGMTTNGFLLTRDKARKIKELHIEYLQITLDGDRDTHNARRYTTTGEATYDKILQNVLGILREGLKIILRINVDKDNVDKACSVLHMIPVEYRKQVTISVANFYQEKNKVDTFFIYKRAIELGYQYAPRKNTYMACQVCLKNGLIVGADGNIIVCANADSKNKILGYIDENGEQHIQDTVQYYKLKTVSAIQNTICRECVELPICIASCKYKRSMNNTDCCGKRSDGLSVKEVALLDLMADEQTTV